MDQMEQSGQEPGKQETDYDQGKIIGQMANGKPYWMLRWIKIKGSDRIGKQTDRELNPVDNHHYQ
jgi:hypothetical protein